MIAQNSDKVDVMDRLLTEICQVIRSALIEKNMIMAKTKDGACIMAVMDAREDGALDLWNDGAAMGNI